MKEFTLLNNANKVYYKLITTVNHSSNDEKISSLIFLKQLFQQHLDAPSGSSMMDVYAVDRRVLSWTKAATTQTCSSVLISVFITDLLANRLHCQMYFCMSYRQTQTDIYNQHTFGFFNIINQMSKTLGFGIEDRLSSADKPTWKNVIWIEMKCKTKIW